MIEENLGPSMELSDKHVMAVKLKKPYQVSRRQATSSIRLCWDTRRKLQHCPAGHTLAGDSLLLLAVVFSHETRAGLPWVESEATCMLLMLGLIAKYSPFTFISHLSTTIKRPSKMAANQQTSFEKSLDLFRRELSNDQIKQINGVNQKTVTDAIQEIQNRLGRRDDLCKLTRVQRFLHAMEHIEKLVTIFLNASDFVAFIWVELHYSLG